MKGCPRWRWSDSETPLRRILERGGILAVPTESSYALAVDPANRRAVASLFALKGRAAKKPLPVVVGDLAQALRLGADLDHPALAPLLGIWPAPLTLVVPLRRALAAAAGGESLALRIPAHRRLRRLLLSLGTGVTSTSANASGEPAATDPEAVAALLEGYDAAVVDDGELPGGPPSTIVELDRGSLRLLRAGAYPVERLVGLVAVEPGAVAGTH